MIVVILIDLVDSRWKEFEKGNLYPFLCVTDSLYRLSQAV